LKTELDLKQAGDRESYVKGPCWNKPQAGEKPDSVFRK
jgi:hypothetical protein